MRNWDKSLLREKRAVEFIVGGSAEGICVSLRAAERGRVPAGPAPRGRSPGRTERRSFLGGNAGKGLVSASVFFTFTCLLRWSVRVCCVLQGPRGRSTSGSGSNPHTGAVELTRIRCVFCSSYMASGSLSPRSPRFLFSSS